MSIRPPEIFVLQPGGLGDIVLASQLIGALKRAYPAKRIVLGVDSAFQGLPALFPIVPDEVFALNLNPYASVAPGPVLYNALRPICERLASYSVTTFIGAEYRPRWLSLFMAAVLRPQTVITSSVDSILDRPILQAALAEFGLSEPIISSPSLPENLAEPERYRSLAKFITGSSWPDFEWSASPSAEAAALAWLGANNIQSGRYILCFPLGSPSAPIKRWPMQRFIEVLNQVAKVEGLAVVFAGSLAEDSDMRAAAARIHVPAKVSAGPDFQLLSGLVSQARVFLGNDTGLMHLAQALKIPGVAIFGGGYWPAYRPWAPGMIGIIHSLPCFQCGWDCLFEHAVCIDRIPMTVVADQLRATVHSPPPKPRVIDTSLDDDATKDLIHRANSRYRAITRDYHQMGNELVRIQGEAERRAQALEEAGREVSLIQGEAERRARALEEMHGELLAVSFAAEQRARALEALNRELSVVRGEAERALALEEMHRELLAVSAAAEQRAHSLEALNHELSAVRGEAERRALALEEMHGELLAVSGAAEQRAHSLEALNHELSAVRGEAERRARALEEMHGELLAVSAAAEQRAHSLEALNHELSVVRGEAERRARALDEMHGELLAVSAAAEQQARALEAANRELEALRAEAECPPCAPDETGSQLVSVDHQANGQTRALEAGHAEPSLIRAGCSGNATSQIWAFQISTGLGAGNIGDELMARAFWDHMPTDVALEVGLFPESVQQHECYPQNYRYRPVEWDGNESTRVRDLPGLLVGDTPVTDAEGLHWPMQFLAARLQHFHDLGQPVDAVGVGVDHSLESDARRLFHDHFLPIRSWTVRSNVCKDSLISLGVPESRIRVGADWAWLYRPRQDLQDWARAFWRKLQIDPEGALIVVNVVNMQWRDRLSVKRAIAAALDWASERMAMQVAFFCNECRPGDFFDYAAAQEIVAFMRNPAVVVPNEYYSPSEAIALLGCATVTLGQRYHFLIESVLAGCVPVGVLRGEKMRNLASELSIPVAGTVEDLEKEEVTMAIQQATEQRADILCHLDKMRNQLSQRAMDNLAFVRTLPPYADATW